MENNFAETGRDVLRKAVFVSPLILTLPVFPSFAKAGSPLSLSCATGRAT